ncbi:MAG: hypothetical protein AB8G86_18535, partial [Saprospiraceae bacterium]
HKRCLLILPNEKIHSIKLSITYDLNHYVYDPDFNKLEIYHRKGEKLEKVATRDWTSPLLKFRLLWTKDTLKLFHPNGEPFLSYAEIIANVKSSNEAIEKAVIKAEKAEAKVEYHFICFF